MASCWRPSYLRAETSGFASPPRGGFALGSFVLEIASSWFAKNGAALNRRAACWTSVYLERARVGAVLGCSGPGASTTGTTSWEPANACVYLALHLKRGLSLSPADVPWPRIASPDAGKVLGCSRSPGLVAPACRARRVPVRAAAGRGAGTGQTGLQEEGSCSSLNHTVARALRPGREPLLIPLQRTTNARGAIHMSAYRTLAREPDSRPVQIRAPRLQGGWMLGWPCGVLSFGIGSGMMMSRAERPGTWNAGKTR